MPLTADGLGEDEAYELLAGLGLVAGQPPLPVAAPWPVEVVLSLDHEDLRELDAIRAARAPAAEASTPVEALPSLEPAFGGGSTGRNDPCPCGSGRKFKKCHGR